MERQKGAIIDAYVKQGQCIAFPYVPSLIDPYAAPPTPAADGKDPVYTDVIVPDVPPEPILCELDSIAAALFRICEPSDARVIPYFVYYYQIRRFYATAARLVQRQIEDKLLKDHTLRLATLFRLLGYHNMVTDVIRSLPVRFPEKYTPF